MQIHFADCVMNLWGEKQVISYASIHWHLLAVILKTYIDIVYREPADRVIDSPLADWDAKIKEATLIILKPP